MDLLPPLARWFGLNPFTTEAARRYLQLPASEARSLGQRLRAQLGQPFPVGEASATLEAAGFVYGTKRRWRFVPVAPAEPAPADDYI